MSSLGRFHDNLWDILSGHDDGKGVHHPGPLADMPLGEFTELLDLIDDAAIHALWD